MLTAEVINIPYIRKNHTKNIRDLAGEEVVLFPEQMKMKGGKPEKIVIGKNDPNNGIFVMMPFRYLNIKEDIMKKLTQAT